MKGLGICLSHDMRAGKGFLLASGFAGVILALAVSIGFWTRASLRGIDPTQLSLGDYFTNYLAGIISQGLSLFGTGGRPFYLPSTWLLTMLIPCYTVLWYPRKDLEAEGMQVLLRSGSRLQWWLAKNVWVAMGVFSYWLAGYSTICVVALVTGATMGLVNTENIAALLALGENSVAAWEQSVAPMLPSVPIISIALALVETAIGTWASPVWGFCLVTATLFMSAFLPGSFLIGNYLMALRSAGMVAGGAAATMGVSLGAVMAIAALALGSVAFKRLDIMGRGERQDAH